MRFSRVDNFDKVNCDNAELLDVRPAASACSTLLYGFDAWMRIYQSPLVIPIRHTQHLPLHNLQFVHLILRRALELCDDQRQIASYFKHTKRVTLACVQLLYELLRYNTLAIDFWLATSIFCGGDKAIHAEPENLLLAPLDTAARPPRCAPCWR